jgi:hypothetical protein
MIHTVILLVLVYAALKAIFKRLTRPAPYKMQLVSRTYAAHESGSTIEESTRLMREQLERTREMALASRDIVDAHRAKQYYADCAKRRAKFERDLI